MSLLGCEAGTKKRISKEMIKKLGRSRFVADGFQELLRGILARELSRFHWFWVTELLCRTARTLLSKEATVSLAKSNKGVDYESLDLGNQQTSSSWLQLRRCQWYSLGCLGRSISILDERQLRWQITVKAIFTRWGYRSLWPSVTERQKRKPATVICQRIWWLPQPLQLVQRDCPCPRAWPKKPFKSAAENGCWHQRLKPMVPAIVRK